MSGGFSRRLSLFDAVMIVVSGIIGSGIFINPHLTAALLRTPFLTILAWVVGGAIALAGAFVFAELGTVMPKVGGQYAYLRKAFHPLAGFLHGWSLLMLIQSGAMAAVSVTFGQYLVHLLGMEEGHATAMGIAVLLGLGAFHALGIKPGAIVVGSITFTKTLALVALVAGAFLFSERSGLEGTVHVPSGTGGTGAVSLFLAALVPVMFTYGGWQNLSFVAEELKDPVRTIPRAVLIGVCSVILVYVGITVAYVHVLGMQGLIDTSTPAAALAGELAGTWGDRTISALVVASTFGFLNLGLMTAPRVYYAMAADGLFPPAIARLHPRTHAPVAAIALQIGMACVFAMLNTYAQLLAFAVFADWIFFAMAGIALIVFRRTLPDAPRPVPSPWYPVTVCLFILAGAGIVANLFVTDTRNALMGLAILCAGVPVYRIWGGRPA